MNWYETQNWYAPLNPAGEETEALCGGEKGTKKKEKKHRGMTAARIWALIFILLLVIAGTSVAFRHVGTAGSGFSFDIPEGEEEFPGSAEDFFKQYYEAIEADTSEVNIPKSMARPSFRLALQEAPEEELSLQELYERCAPAIVSISAYSGDSVGYNWGSGIIMTGDGLILTNTHILADCDSAVVTMTDGTDYDAELIGADAISDIAVLKVDAQGLPTADFGDSAGLRVGDSVAAIGNPLGEDFRNTLTDGIISAIERGMTIHGHSMMLLQTNTAINEGNSGGALFNRYGQVIGITNMKMMSSYSSIEGIGFAIPSASLQRIVNSLLEHGEVLGRPAIGITVGSIPESAKERYDLPEGLYVTAVSEGSDAMEKGIREGDIILKVDGQPVTTTQEISDMKNALQVGDSMTFTIWRDGEEMEISIVLIETNEIYS